MNKREIILRFTERLRQQLDTMLAAARSAREASTGAEAKAESKYDTRGLEASYLADAQAGQSAKISRCLESFEAFAPIEFPPEAEIQPGTLVETELDGTLAYYLLTPCAGGMCIDYQGCELTTVSPESPLYQSLLGKCCGDIIDPAGMLILGVS